MTTLTVTHNEWNRLWWEEFHKLRHLYPTLDLVYLQKQATRNIEFIYGPMPKAETGPPLWLKTLALTIGVPMGFLGKFWEFMNGKKTVVGAIITALSVAAGYLPAVLAFFGVETVKIATIVGIVTTVVGVLHKIYKFIYKEDHP